jgi:hypothetical protein
MNEEPLNVYTYYDNYKPSMTDEDLLLLHKAAEKAYDAMDACNLSGVCHDFSKILSDVLWPLSNKVGGGTDWVNQHPISVMLTSKLYELARTETTVQDDKLWAAFKWRMWLKDEAYTRYVNSGVSHE